MNYESRGSNSCLSYQEGIHERSVDPVSIVSEDVLPKADGGLRNSDSGLSTVWPGYSLKTRYWKTYGLQKIRMKYAEFSKQGMLKKNKMKIFFNKYLGNEEGNSLFGKSPHFSFLIQFHLKKSLVNG